MTAEVKPNLTRSAALMFLTRLSGYPPYASMDSIYTDGTLAMIVDDVERNRGIVWSDVVSPLSASDELPLPRVIDHDEDGPILEEEAWA